MDPALKIFLESSNYSPIWVAVDGVIISGRVRGMREFFGEIILRSGQDEEAFQILLDNMLEGSPIHEEHFSETNQHVLFDNANIFINGRFASRSPVSVDLEKVAVWGPGLFSTPDTPSQSPSIGNL